MGVQEKGRGVRGESERNGQPGVVTTATWSSRAAAAMATVAARYLSLLPCSCATRHVRLRAHDPRNQIQSWPSLRDMIVWVHTELVWHMEPNASHYRPMRPYKEVEKEVAFLPALQTQELQQDRESATAERRHETWEEKRVAKRRKPKFTHQMSALRRGRERRTPHRQQPAR